MKVDVFLSNQNRHVRFLLGLYISRKRNELGLSIQDIASHINLSPQTYKRIEAGSKKVNATVFEKMHSLLSFNQEDLMEIRRIATISYVNDLSKALTANYPL